MTDTPRTQATGSQDATVKLWNRAGLLQHTLVAHASAVTALCFGRGCLVTSSFGGDTCVWTNHKCPVTTLRSGSGAEAAYEVTSVDLIDDVELLEGIESEASSSSSHSGQLCWFLFLFENFSRFIEKESNESFGF